MTLTKLGNIVNQSPARKNVLNNANFGVWQRGTSGFTNSGMTADQWLLSPSSTGAVEVHQDTSGPSTIMYNNIYIDVTTADTSPTGGDFIGLIQKIEGYNARWIIDIPATLSFWAKSSTPGIYCVSLRKHDYSYSYIIEYIIDSANTWERKVVTFSKIDQNIIGNLNLGAVHSLNIAFMVMNGTTYANSTTDEWLSGNYLTSTNQVNLMASTSNYFQLAGVQFEPGRVATDFEYQSYDEELRACQRYYWTNRMSGNNYGYRYYPQAGTGIFGGALQYPVTMRTTPTVAVTEASYYNCTNNQVYANAFGLIHLVNVSSAALYRVAEGLYTATAEL